MAECIDCAKQIGLFSTFGEGRCRDCNIAYVKQRNNKQRMANMDPAVAAEEMAEAEAIARDQADYEQQIAAIILTTEVSSNLPVSERIEIVTAECAFGMNIFKDLFASVRDIVGGRSEAVQKTMRDARRTALFELKREAHTVGADAVVGVDLDYVELSGAGNMVMLVASGTAVKLATAN